MTPPERQPPRIAAAAESRLGLDPATAYALALAWLAAATCRAPLLAVGPLLPLIIPDLRLSSTVAGALTGLPLLILGAVSAPAGLLSDRLGPRWMLVVGQLGIALGSGLRGLAQNEIVLLAASLVMGAGIGLSQPALAQVVRTLSPRRVGLAAAVYANGLMIGGMAGLALPLPVLLPLSGSWRGVLLIWAVVCLMASAGWALSPRPERASAPSARTPALTLRQLVAIPGLAPLVVAFASQASVFFTSTSWWSEYYVALGWRLADTSWPLTILSLAAIVGGTAAPAFAAWMGGSRPPLMLGAVMTVASVVGMAVAPGGDLLWAGGIGLGTSFAFTLGLAAPAELAPREQVGAVAGMALSLSYLCSFLGPLVFGALRDLGGGFGLSLAFLVGLSAILLVASLAIPKGVKRTA